MNLTHMLSELRSERQQLEEAILVLQRLAIGGAKRLGRPPKWMVSAEPARASEMPTRRRKPFSAATRKKMAAAQRKRWAKVKKTA